mgnify:CR=1 FL=1
MDLEIDYVTLTDVDAKSFARSLSFYGKPKGLKDLKDRQRSLETWIDNVTEIQNVFANVTCSSLKPQALDNNSLYSYSSNWVFVNPKNGEVVLDVAKDFKGFTSTIRDLVEKLNNGKWLCDILKDPKTLKLKNILDYFDRKIVSYSNDLLKVQNEIEKVSKPAPVEKWRLVFVFSRANVEVVGQAAKNLYAELLAAKSDLNLKMHVKETNQTKYETKFALIVDSYEIL